MNIAESQMKQAVLLARSGERERAAVLFTRLVEQDPQNYRGWLWLSELSDNIEEQVTSLENAYRYAPVDSQGCKDLQGLLIEIRGCIVLSAPIAPAAPAALNNVPIKRLDPVETMQHVERLLILGKRTEAANLIRDLKNDGAMNERAWQIDCDLNPNPAEKIQALEQVLIFNPGNDEAAMMMNIFRLSAKQPMDVGAFLESKGEQEQAKELYSWLVENSPSRTEQEEARRRILRLETHFRRQDAPVPQRSVREGARKWVNRLFS
jgi:tetratricopeptide (TPR) repeat protein